MKKMYKSLTLSARPASAWHSGGRSMRLGRAKLLLSRASANGQRLGRSLALPVPGSLHKFAQREAVGNNQIG